MGDEVIKKLESVENEVINLNGKFQNLLIYILKIYEEKNNYTAECVENESSNNTKFSDYIVQEEDIRFDNNKGDNNFLGLKKTFSNTPINMVQNSLSSQKANVDEILKSVNKITEDLHVCVDEVYNFQSNIHERKKEVLLRMNEVFVNRQLDKYQEIIKFINKESES